MSEIYRYQVHSFGLGDVEDPDIYAAGPLWEWQNTEQGQWVLEHAADKPVYHIRADTNTWGHRVVVEADFAEPQAIQYCLKYLSAK